jgi:hypothetical protein
MASEPDHRLDLISHEEQEEYYNERLMTHIRAKKIIIATNEMKACASVCSPTVRIIAFQAIDPGSTPGKRKCCYF